MKKVVILAAINLLLPIHAWSLHNKEPATLVNTAIISLILLPVLVLILFFWIQKRQAGRRSDEHLKGLTVTDKRFAPERIRADVEKTIDVVLRACHGGERGDLKARFTPELAARYERDPSLFNDYEGVSYDMVLSADGASRSVEVVVNCGLKSRKETRHPSREEAWRFVLSVDGWLLDSLREVEVGEYLES